MTVSALTDFGDLALMLPLAGVVLLWLVGARARAGAGWWIVAVLLCAGGTALLKIYFFACSLSPELRSPSGHASLSTLVYGTLTLLVALEAQGWRRLLVLGLGLALIVAIADSRILLGAHSVIEVAFGLAIGFMALGVFAYGYLRHPPARARLPTLLLAVVLSAIVLHGSNLRAEEILHALSGYLRVGGLACASTQ